MTKKVLVTGSNGQLGCALKRLKNPYNSYIFFDRNSLDITNKEPTVNILKAIKPDYVVNCAAYTNVDKAETDREMSHFINVDGVDNIANAAWLAGSKLIHISTDYVFDGEKNEPYTRFDETNPINYYGETKRDGEISALCYPNTIVLRTSWLYSHTHNCFFTKILDNIKSGKLTRVKSYEIGSPTNADTLAEFIDFFIETDGFKDKSGIYHYANSGSASRFQFARTIQEIYNMLTKKNEHYIIGTTDRFLSEAKRPKYSVLDIKDTERDFGLEIQDWRIALFRTCCEAINNDD